MWNLFCPNPNQEKLKKDVECSRASPQAGVFVFHTHASLPPLRCLFSFAPFTNFIFFFPPLFLTLFPVSPPPHSIPALAPSHPAATVWQIDAASLSASLCDCILPVIELSCSPRRPLIFSETSRSRRLHHPASFFLLPSSPRQQATCKKQNKN